MSATSSWGAFTLALTNFADTDQQARVLVSYKDFPEVQYGRDVWLPARATLSTWMLVGPAPANLPGMACDIQMTLEDISGGNNQTVLPNTEERIRSRGIPYRRREPFTTILLDDELPEEFLPGQLPHPDSRSEEAERLVRVFRQTRALSHLVQTINPGPLPPTAEAFDGVDHVVLASGRFAKDPAGTIALRHWLERGGKVWVMLDLVEPEALASLLGEALDFQIVDRLGLTSFRIETHPKGRGIGEPPLQQYERPVEFVRVQLPPQEHVRHTIDGWPVWFTRRLGRGDIVFSTLGPRGWYRERTERDPLSPYPDFPNFPMANRHLEDLGMVLQPSDKEAPSPIQALQPLLTEEIGYSVVHRSTVVLIFLASLLGALVLGIFLRKISRPELMGWLGPAAALSATVVLLFVGERSRRAVPPTVAVAQIVEAVSGRNEAVVNGLLNVYRPIPGPIEAGAEQGGLFYLDGRDMNDQVRQFLLTDLDAWHWERFTLLAEPRQASFHITLPTEKPIAALAHFDSKGVEGKLSGPFQNLSDALLSTPNGRKLSVRIQPDGTFRTSGSDVLSKNQYLADTILTDRQQRRRDFYGVFLEDPGPASLRGRNVLLAWTDPLDMHFRIAPEARKTGSALVVAPLQMERLKTGQRATVPGAFLSYQRLLDGAPTRPNMESNDDMEMHLRFQLPAEVLPFKVERAQLSARIEAPGRRVTIAAQDGKQLTEIHRVDSPLDPIRIEISKNSLLHVDDDGGLHLTLTIGDPSLNGIAKEKLPRPAPPQGNQPGERLPRGGNFQGGPPQFRPPQGASGGRQPPEGRPGGMRPPGGQPKGGPIPENPFPGGPPQGFRTPGDRSLRGEPLQEVSPPMKTGLLEEKWRIQYLELEVSGRSIAEPQ